MTQGGPHIMGLENTKEIFSHNCEKKWTRVKIAIHDLNARDVTASVWKDNSSTKPKHFYFQRICLHQLT